MTRRPRRSSSGRLASQRRARRSSSQTSLIAAGILAGLFVLALVGYMLLGGGDDPDSPSPTSSSRHAIRKALGLGNEKEIRQLVGLLGEANAIKRAAAMEKLIGYRAEAVPYLIEARLAVLREGRALSLKRAIVGNLDPVPQETAEAVLKIIHLKHTALQAIDQTLIRIGDPAAKLLSPRAVSGAQDAWLWSPLVMAIASKSKSAAVQEMARKLGAKPTTSKGAQKPPFAKLKPITPTRWFEIVRWHQRGYKTKTSIAQGRSTERIRKLRNRYCIEATGKCSDVRTGGKTQMVVFLDLLPPFGGYIRISVKRSEERRWPVGRVVGLRLRLDMLSYWLQPGYAKLGGTYSVDSYGSMTLGKDVVIMPRSTAGDGSGNEGKQARRFVGSSNSMKLHTATCPLSRRVRKRHRVWFDSPAKALKQGYRWCSVCKQTGSYGD